MANKILVLLSGGIDSSLCCEMLKANTVHAVAFDYQQPHLIELEYAERFAANRVIPFRRVKLNTIPKKDSLVFAGRNAILLANAIGIAVSEGFSHVVIGVNASDSVEFSDCRPDFISAFSTIAQTYGVTLLTPLLRNTKSEIVSEAKRLNILQDTWTCYAPTQSGEQCGECYACKGKS